jgi:hypothetical protein
VRPALPFDLQPTLRACTLVALFSLPVALAAGVSPAPSAAAMPSPWVLIALNSEIRIYVDSTRIEWHRPDGLPRVWLRFIHTHPQLASRSPTGPRVKEIDVQVSLNCHTLEDHAYYLKLRDSLEIQLGDGPISLTGQQQTDAALIARNVVGVTCEWLKDPGRLPVRY